MKEIKVDAAMVQAFHQMWDGFPGIVRLMDKNHIVHASNEAAVARGHVPGVCCAKVGPPESHIGCLAHKALKEQTAYTDRPADGIIRGWMPVAGNPELLVHYTVFVPDVNK